MKEVKRVNWTASLLKVLPTQHPFSIVSLSSYLALPSLSSTIPVHAYERRPTYLPPNVYHPQNQVRPKTYQAR